VAIGGNLASAAPAVEAHSTKYTGRTDETAPPDALSPEQKSGHKKGADEPPDVEAHCSRFGG
jgi:hypothetical protein